MPELTRLFQSGRMNKDLDERLIQNGEYRDALNLDLANSENGNIGSLQNVKGNTVIRNNISGGAWEENSIEFLNSPIVVGSYKDDIAEKIYWFIKAKGYYDPNATPTPDEFPDSEIIENAVEAIVSVIAEYDQIKNTIAPVLVDTKGILEFSESYLITGVNKLDKFLFWTDGQKEPKKINIEKFKLGSVDFTSHTKVPAFNAAANSYESDLTGRPDFEEKDVTVIKKSPLNAPGLLMGASKFGADIAGTGINPVRTKYNVTNQENFTYLPDTNDPAVYQPIPTFGEYLANIAADPTYYSGTSLGSSWNGKVTFSILAPPSYGTYQGKPVWKKGDVLSLTGSKIDDYNNTFEYTIEILVDEVSGDDVTGQIQITPNEIQKFTDSNGNSDPIIWDVVLKEGQPLFEYIFPRFAYRWKYIDNEYSTFSPFSEVAFVPGRFEYIAADGYNTGMQNNVRSLTLTGIEWGDDEVEEVEILYKKTNDSTIYSVEKLKRSESIVETSVGNFLNSNYTIESELTGAVIEASQILRPWDNVPRTAKAQEIIANRIVYGNYLQNYNVNTVNLSVELTKQLHKANDPQYIVDGNNPLTRTPEASLKSLRTYQVGIVYKDEYGRETPIFSSEEASVTLDITDSALISKIAVTPTTTPPPWATHYKFFIKDVSNEYYNLSMDRFYEAEDGNVWLSFPSAERNKLDEETYLILKKQHDNNVPVTSLSKSKVLSIKNQAPNFLREFETIEFFGSVLMQSLISPGDLTVVFQYDLPKDNNSLNEQLVTGNVLRIFEGNNRTSDYVIEKGGVLSTEEVSGTEVANYQITLKSPLGGDAEFLTNFVIDQEIQIEIGSLELKDKPEFEGRFFVKIGRDLTFEQNIVNPFKALQPSYVTVNSRLFRGLLPSGENKNLKGVYSWADAGDNYGQNNCPGKASNYKLYGPGYGGFGSKLTDQQIKYLSPPTRGRDIVGFNRHAPGKVDEDPFIGTGWNESEDQPDKIFTNMNGDLRQGSKIRFRNGSTGDSSQIYIIEDIYMFLRHRGRRAYILASFECRDNNSGFNEGVTVGMKLDKPLEESMFPNVPSAYALSQLEAKEIEIEVVTDDFDGDNKLLTSTNPAIYETEPKEGVDLDLYYEASDALPINTHGIQQTLDYSNCFAFGNGVESNRIRDDFNAQTIDKGTKVSTVLDEPYAEEQRQNGFIFSQIFNSTSGVNKLNQFIQAEQITKDINPIYGSIQKMHARDTDLIALCEDKCLKVLANKDALFNADGNANLTSNKAVLGQVVPYSGEYGISKNPESFASHGFRSYFTDKARGVIIRLSKDGITLISDKGMSDFFSDNLKETVNLIGSYDADKGLYNLTLDSLSEYWQKELTQDKNYNLISECKRAEDTDNLVYQTTVSYKEAVDGWTSRKSFIPESGVSLNNRYYTFKQGNIYEHNNRDNYNLFYGVQHNSSVNMMINDQPNVVKGFSTLNYSGTQSQEIEYLYNNKWYSIAEVRANQIIPTQSRIKQDGWYVNYIRTDLESGDIKEFLDKENKFFNNIEALEVCDLEPAGIGDPETVETTEQDYLLNLTLSDTCSSTGETTGTPDATQTLWDVFANTEPSFEVIVRTTTYPDNDELKCAINDYYAAFNNDYTTGQRGSTRFSYFSADGWQVGTQLYDPVTLVKAEITGRYIYAGQGSASIVANEIYPLAGSTTPDVYTVVYLLGGIINSITQYNTINPDCSTPIIISDPPEPTIITCDLEWTTENTTIQQLRDGTPIFLATNAQEWADNMTGPVCCYRNFDPANAHEGLYYNYRAAENIAPEGWRVPRRIDYERLRREPTTPLQYNFFYSRKEDHKDDLVLYGCNPTFDETIANRYMKDDGTWFDMRPDLNKTDWGTVPLFSGYGGLMRLYHTPPSAPFIRFDRSISDFPNPENGAAAARYGSRHLMWVSEGRWSTTAGQPMNPNGVGWDCSGVMCGTIYNEFYNDPLLPGKNHARFCSYGLVQSDIWGCKIRFCRDVEPYEIQ